ncbi:MAG: sigma-54-dependent transcriptional regulator [Armatimonadota bacterium]
MPERILVVDDQQETCELLEEALGGAGYAVECAPDGETAVEAVKSGKDGYDLVVLDLDFGPAKPDGLSALAELKRIDGDLPVVMLSGKGTIETAVQAMEAGAAYFVEKTPYMADTLLPVVQRELRAASQLRKTRELQSQNVALARERDYFRERLRQSYDIIGDSAPMQEVLRLVDAVASLPRAVLICGERGTGKELVAAAIHYGGSRADGPFVVVNCAAIAEGLLECELFGQEENAFDGAPFKLGRFEIADHGTLFLDEIGNMSLDFQMKILRVIEYQSFERVQGTERIDVDVRILAATNADIQGAIEAGRFRPDLYDRIAFQVIDLPPLRDRKEDIPVLCEHFIARFAEEIAGVEPKPVAPAALERLTPYDWPGNVRELKNVIEGALCRATGPEIGPGDLLLPQTDVTEAAEGFSDRVASFEKSLLLEALESNNWNQKKAAAALELKYDQLRHLYKKYDLRSLRP